MASENKNKRSSIDQHDDKEMRKQKQALTRKLDLHILPLLSIIYLNSYMIRSNIANAKLVNLEDDLQLTSDEYQWALSIFFFGYVLFEVPSNIVLRRWQPSRWLSIIHIFLGIAAICMGAVKNAAGLLVCRFFLGIFEAGLFPGIIYFISLWYSKKQQAIRIGLFWSFSALSGAFSGVLAYGISRISSAKLAQWRLIFILEGAPTFILALCCWFLLPNSPEKAKFLNDQERQLEIDRLAKDAGPIKKDKFSWSQVLSVFIDWKTYIYAIIYITGTIATQGITLSLPMIIKNLGEWTPFQAQLLTIPPYMAAFFAILIVSYSSDHFMERSLHCSISNLWSICGFLILMLIDQKRVGVLYVGIIFAAIGTYANVSIKIAWFNNNFASLTRRAIAVAVIVSIGTSGGAIAGQIYQAKQKPRYFIGHTISFCCVVLQTTLIIILRFILMIINHRRKRMNDEQIKQQVEKYGGEEFVGDHHPKFRYTL
ncbi:unnamed protein product [Rotaria sordida]|uniref:Major facilitator superfamily (MFS) profile domain-containing protein n=1 Tax=Rotaria sordida TaxID=392033 RepID=A0A813ZSX5_9BILA|nr:unnamed protein product [Rotaria sordida]CAF3603483.1 unnamed protein product [Rotaria sordida]